MEKDYPSIWTPQGNLHDESGRISAAFWLVIVAAILVVSES